MGQPQVSWYNVSNTSQITNWQIGTVDAGNTSDDTTFLIWNNRGGTEDIADMTDCTITTKDESGGNEGEIISNKWIRVRVDSMNENSFTPVGGEVTKTIKAGGTAPAGTIKGTKNDGTKTNALNNFCQVTLHAQPHVTATAGNVNFLLRVSYTYT
ncbi:hypothetical protein [Paenibacillus sp. J2TS4]|uniref:hypothetical protein n=1 Tax=Paenibacillus sp. J2TS4 TaxID=2807194 RepID=UPI001B2F7667|nr:hypothetical protein [Paenibacillus sp. J2TS4]GIP32598.1 hypothetical protein J2TS4_18080 [Paenibacillus sp. J2TS4]